MLFISITILALMNLAYANLWCYSCVSSEPGCGEFGVDWLMHSSKTCPKEDDKCVKIIERKGVSVQITRGCLSEFEGIRRDIPADTYEGCRPAAAQPKVGVYITNDIPQLDLQRNFWDNVTYCFCENDEWCNSSISLSSDKLLMFISFMLFKWIYSTF